jgi:hypothetical protein
MNIPQINGAIVSNQAEAHLSAASIHIDFSIVKIHDEWRDIGRSLSARRKTEADEGQSRLTAAELGILFGGLVPNVPNLISAYGSRCSEIANSPTFNPKGSSQHGLFADEVGVDGTSVWAAATSGDASIAVLLLACMLSRMWDPPKAVSIWMQLIAERKQNLAASTNPLERLASSNINLTRDQIASWHASTHAWRLTADEANARRQNQLILIINNLGIPVNTKLSLSESVISAWQTAMVTVDQLVAGNPQNVQSGAPLLGLAAWHLYPNMIVFCHGKYGKPVDVLQSDPLIPASGIMTLGLEDRRRSGDGLYWSLPLAHLRYYGQPVRSEALLSSRTSRTSVNDLIFVALGSLIRRWCASTDEIELALRILVQLNDSIDIPGSFRRESSWLALLAFSASTYLEAGKNIQAEKLQLIRCGQRRYPLFIDDPRSDSLFGLSAPHTFLRLLPGNAARVNMLRNVAKDFGDSRYLMIIQCKSGCPHTNWELSSVERLYSTHKRTYDSYAELDAAEPPRRFVRWLSKYHWDDIHEDVQPDSEHVDLDTPIPGLWAPYGYQWQNAPQRLYGYLLERETKERDWLNAKSVTIRSLLAFGDPDVAALYCLDISYWTQDSPNDRPKSIGRKQYRPLPNIFVAKHISWALEEKLVNVEWALEENLVSGESLFAHLNEGRFSLKMLKSLRALLSVSMLYKDLANSTIDLRVAEKPLFRHSWIPSDSSGHRHEPFAPFSLTREEAFACIARFESGSFNLHPSSMDRVIAISSGNSIYVARCLLQDPCGSRSSTAIERIVGNIGKAGMAFLVCPDIPDVREETTDPQVIAHHAFDCREEDCFSQTSLQLSFTGWELAIDVGSRGNRDIEASYVEAAIQLYDHGKWVADLNILDIFRHRFSLLLPPCSHHIRLEQPREELCKFVSIDSWEELLDCPIEIGVIRARGNWQARLAAAALAIQRGHETRVIPDQACWPCYLTLERRSPHTAKIIEKPMEDDDDDDDDTFGALPEHFDQDGSDSETEEVVQASMREDERKVSQIGGQEHHRERSPTKKNRSNRNIVYIL